MGRLIARIVLTTLFVVSGVALLAGATAEAAPGEPPVTLPNDPSLPPTVEPSPPAEEDPTIPSPVPTLPPVDSDAGPLPQGDSLIPDAGVGAYPTFNYDIGYDEGSVTSFSRKFFGSLTAVAWLVNLAIVGVVLWFSGWAFSFDIIGPIKGPILTVAEAWNTNMIGSLGLNDFVWFIVMTYVAFQVWRGRAMNAMGELLVSVLALGVSLIIGANPGGYLDGAERSLQTVSGATMSISRGQAPTGDPDQAATLVEPMRLQLHEVLVEEPYEVINWGGPVTGACATVLPGILQDGPWGAKDDPRNAMRDAGCDDEYDFNHQPTAERMAGAYMAASVSAVVLVFVLVTVVTMIIASLFFILKFAWLPWALLAGQLPGAGRELFWGWLVGLLKNGSVVVAMSFIFSYLLMFMSAFLTAPGLGIAQRFALILIVAVTMFFKRKDVLKGIDHFWERVRGELGSWRPGLNGRGYGGYTGSSASAGVAGMTGFGIGQRAREATLDMPGSRAYDASHMGRRFQYQKQRRHGGRLRSRSNRGYRQRMRAGR